MSKARSVLLLAGVALLTTTLTGPVSGRRVGNSGDAIWADPAARASAIKAGAPLYRRHCAGCHGSDAKGTGAAHTPDLTDGRWLFGGTDIDTFLIRPSDIAFTIVHGIRSGDPKARNLALMPALGTGHSLDSDEVAAVTEYVLKLSGQPYDANKLAAGKETYEGEGGCYDCHAVQGWGDPAIGAADLTSPQTWL